MPKKTTIKIADLESNYVETYTLASNAAINYNGPLTAEMIPFSRLPDMVLPDQALAEVTAAKLNSLF